MLIIPFYTEILGKMNVWLFNDTLQNDFLDTIIKPDYLKKSMFIIILDLTKVSLLAFEYCFYF